jgi:glutaredoxin
MFCVIALIVLSILGIFSATNRRLAQEALDCVLRRVTLRPCNTGFDEKMKARILGSVIIRSEGAARFLNKYFEVLSWAFFVLLMVSSIYSVRSGYLYYTTGSCDGLNSSSFCVFDPAGANNQISSLDSCEVDPTTESDLTLAGIDLTGMPRLDHNAQDDVVMIGCYQCDYTRAAYPDIQELVQRYQPNFIFIHYPVIDSSDYLTRVGYCIDQQNPQLYWTFVDSLFQSDKSQLEDKAFISQAIAQLGINQAEIDQCAEEQQTKDEVQRQLKEVEKTGFYGTPTIFINGDALVGPKPYRVYAIRLKGLFYWLQ